MEKPHFEITYVPKHTKVVQRIQEKLENPTEFENEVHRILKKNSIVPTKLYIKKVEEGTDNELFEGFDFAHFPVHAFFLTGSKGSWRLSLYLRNPYPFCMTY